MKQGTNIVQTTARNFDSQQKVYNSNNNVKKYEPAPCIVAQSFSSRLR